MNQRLIDKICDMKILALKESNFLKPLRAEYKINGKQKFWDFLAVHDSVSILIYNISRDVLVFVRQFRPALYLAQIPEKKENGTIIDTEKHNVSQGYSLELCAGLVDKNTMQPDQIAKEEILEECGVGITGQQQTLYYAEVTDDQKVTNGGGLREEGEFIEVVELTIPEVKDYLNTKDILSPPAFLAAIQWFFTNVKS